MIVDAFVLALTAIRRNALRSFLTMLGVIIGVSAVIIMVTLGAGTTAQVTAEIEDLGSNLIVIVPGEGNRMAGTTGMRAFEVEDAEAILDQIAAVRAVAPIASATMVGVYANENRSTAVSGVDAGYFEVEDWPVVAGRRFYDSEYRSGAAVCVIGDTIRRELFQENDPIGLRLRLGGVSCQVIGVLEAKGQSSFGTDQDDIVYMPLRTFHNRVAGNDDIGVILASIHERASTEKAQRDIIYLMRERRRISAFEDDDFVVRDMKEIVDMLTGTTRIMTYLLGAVAAISLIVGGIGIMNIMLVSVTERTREIGIRLAIGALERDVLLQFLVEAVVLSSVGGLIGVLSALGLSAWLAGLMGIPFIPNPTVIALSFGFSALVGVVFGFFPARRAAGLNPIDALRHE